MVAFGAFAAGRPERAIDLLIDIRPRANAVGGSHAQRERARRSRARRS
jgi:hypothetical protein